MGSFTTPDERNPYPVPNPNSEHTQYNTCGGSTRSLETLIHLAKAAESVRFHSYPDITMGLTSLSAMDYEYDWLDRGAELS